MAIDTSPAQLQSLSDCLLNVSGKTPLHERFRALFTLKAIKGPEAVRIISQGFKDESALLKHELAYVLGQIGESEAVPVLEEALIDKDGFQGDMVRHESAEALGALSSLSSLPLLKSYLNDPARSVRETCEIAVAKIEWDHFTEEGKAGKPDPNFPTIDPAKASLSLSNESIPSLRSTLLNTSLPLFERYQSMFALRNAIVNAKSPSEARLGVDTLSEGFSDSSALFRHEIAYIFGQLSSPYSISSLLHVMRDQEEDDMVRHEAAEALGGIASEGEELKDEDDLFKGNEEDRKKGVLGILREWCTKEEAPSVVKESCQVAVDMWEYENSTQFQYADKLASTDQKDSSTAPLESESAVPFQRRTGMDRGI